MANETTRETRGKKPMLSLFASGSAFSLDLDTFYKLARSMGYSSISGRAFITLSSRKG